MNILIDACWALYYITSGRGEKVSAIVKTGIIPRLVELMSHEEPKIALPAVRIIGGLTSGSDENTQKVIDSGALPKLKTLLHHKSKLIRKDTCWALSNIAAGTPLQITNLLETGIMPDLVNALKLDEFDIKKETLWILCNISSKGASESMAYIAECGAVEALCEQLKIEDVKPLAVALQSIMNLLRKWETELSEPNEIAKRIENCLGLSQIETLQAHPNQIIYKMAVDILERYFSVEEIEENLASGVPQEKSVEKMQEELSIFKF